MSYDLNILKNSIDKNKLSIFVGSGVSKSSNLPLWEDLICFIKKELSLGSKENNNLKIAQLYYLSCGESVYYQKIKEFFPESVEPTKIQKLIFELSPSNIITTNWDNLLEKTVQNNGFIYDVISKDEHLVQSELQNHIIKMHGDFRDNNIVFKEDDYLNYSNNFPLIENYIKSILSTNTILFLGYSYNDDNLKQVIKWIQNHSRIKPPMFLVVFEEDKNQSNYLENFGIKTIVAKKGDNPSKKLAIFLTILKNTKEEGLDIESMSDLEIVDFVYHKLKPLDQLSAILLNQIRSTLTNCGFIYGEIDGKNLILLEFFDEILTEDINEKTREIYKKFKKILKIKNHTKEIERIISKIISILYKANIDGIVFGKDVSQNRTYEILKISKKSINQNEEQLCNFEFNDFETNENDIKILMKKAFFYYQAKEYLKSYKLTKKIILQCLKQKNYIQLFLAMFNHNVLLSRLKHPSILNNIGNNKKYKTVSESWQYQAQSYDLDKQFYELPKIIQKVLKDVKPFISYDYLYKFFSEIDNELTKKQEQRINIKNNNNGFFDSDVTRNYSKQKNLIHFVIGNYIMIEDELVFKKINKQLIEISLIRQVQNKHLTLDKMELFATIKYIEYKNLIQILENFEQKLNLTTKNTNWLIKKVLPNIVKIFNENKTFISYFNDELKNIIYLLVSVQSLNKLQLEMVLVQFKELINNSKITLDVYILINELIGNHNNINKNDLIIIIELMINKIIYDKASVWDKRAVEHNYLYNPTMQWKKEWKYSNKALIEDFLNKLKSYDIERQIKITQGFLYNIRCISDNEIQEKIKSYILDIDLEKITNNYGLKITFKLFLVIKEFIEINNSLIEEIKKYPLETKDNVYFLGKITGQVKYLVDKLGIADLKELLENLQENMGKVNQRNKERNKMINII